MKRIALVGSLVMLSSLLVTPVVQSATGTSRTFFLHWDSPAGDCEGPKYMDLIDGPDSGDGCGYVVQMTGINEVFGATGLQPLLSHDYSATDGVPFVLDASKPITGVFQVNGWAHPLHAGNSVLDVKVSGMAGRSETLVEETLESTVTPAGGNVFEISVRPGKKLHGKKFTSLTVSVVIRGVAVGHHYIDLEDNPAHLVIPTLRK